MIKLLFTLLLVPFMAVANDVVTMPVVSIYDGDTIRSEFSWHMPPPLDKVSIRLYGIDTPEMPAKSYATTGKLGRAKCVKEAEAALNAKKRLIELIGTHKEVRIENFKWGKFGGRVIATVYAGCVNLADTLIKEGHAVEYFGKGKKKDWCQ